MDLDFRSEYYYEYYNEYNEDKDFEVVRVLLSSPTIARNLMCIR